jgi:phosphatidylglycerol:prolipoprotein diacylglycerol transferase
MGIQIGRYTIFYYGIIIMIGAIAAALLAAYEARRRGQSSDVVWDGLVWVLIGGNRRGICTLHLYPPAESGFCILA